MFTRWQVSLSFHRQSNFLWNSTESHKHIHARTYVTLIAYERRHVSSLTMHAQSVRQYVHDLTGRRKPEWKHADVPKWTCDITHRRQFLEANEPTSGDILSGGLGKLTKNRHPVNETKPITTLYHSLKSANDARPDDTFWRAILRL